MKVTLHIGDSREVLRGLPERSVHSAVTSPPYFSLRDYGVAGQIGLESSPDCLAWARSEPSCGECFVCVMREVFAEVWRVLRDDGTCWVNLGDSFANDAKWGGSTSGKHVAALHGGNGTRGRRSSGLKPKDLQMIPARVALALQLDGWYLRSDIVWHKKAAMPESVLDRPTRAHEFVFLLTKQPRYFYDAYAIREPLTGDYGPNNRADREAGRETRVPGASRHVGLRSHATAGNYRSGNRRRRLADEVTGGTAANGTIGRGFPREASPGAGRSARSVWVINPRPFPEAHFATFPPELPELCIKAGTSERGACPTCSAPWPRVVEPTPEYATHLGKDWADYDADQAEGRGHFTNNGGARSGQRCVKRVGAKLTAAYVTSGWAPGCNCYGAERLPEIPDDADEATTRAILARRAALLHHYATLPTVPCVVLDPFSGAGTSGVVAGKLMRDYVGIDLSEVYTEMAERRILREVGPLLVTVDIVPRPTTQQPVAVGGGI